ncbi:MAG: anti-sigma factor family protein [Dehalococcoidia bacterium]
MACARYQSLLSRYIDEALSEREQRQLLAHVEGCPSCSATLARYRQAGVILHRLPTLDPSPQLRDRILAAGAAGERGARTTRGPLSRWARAGLLMAGLGLLAFVGMRGMVGGGAGGYPQVETQPSYPTATTPIQHQKGEAGWDVNPPLTPGSSPSALQEMMVNPSSSVFMPYYLPPGAWIEQMSLETRGSVYVLDAVYFIPPDAWLHLRQVNWPRAQVYMTGLVQQGKIIIASNEWWYGQRLEPELDGSIIHMLLSRRGGLGVHLETPLPLAELIKVAGSVP